MCGFPTRNDLRQELSGRPCQVSAPQLAELAEPAELAAHPELTPRDGKKRRCNATVDQVDPQFRNLQVLVESKVG